MNSKLEIVWETKEALDLVNAVIEHCENTKKRLITLLNSSTETIHDKDKANLEHRSNDELKKFYKTWCLLLSSEISKIKEKTTNLSKDEIPKLLEKMLNTIIWAEIIYNRRNAPITIQQKTHISLEEIREKIQTQIEIIELKLKKIKTIKETIIYLYWQGWYFQEDLNMIVNWILNWTINNTVESILEKHFRVVFDSTEITEREPEFTTSPKIQEPIITSPVKSKNIQKSKKPEKKSWLKFFWQTLKEWLNTDKKVSWKQARENILKKEVN